MSAAQSRDLIVVAAAAAFAVAITIVGGLLTPPAALPGAGSSFSATPRGAKAAYLMLARLGYRVERSFEPLADMRAMTPEIVVIVASPVVAISAADRRAASRLVERGGVLLTAGTGGALLPDFAVTPVPDAGPFAPRPTHAYPAAGQDELAAGARTIVLAPEARAVLLKQPYAPIYAEEAVTAMAAARFGDGRAIWLAGSDPLANQLIAAAGHVELLLNILGPPGERRVVWNEYYHGHARSFWSYVADSPVVALLLQSLVVALAALATFGRRRGPVRPALPEQRTSVLEFVDALGALYRRARAASGAVEVSLQRTRRVLAGVTGLAPTAPDRQVAEAASTRLNLPASQIVSALRAGEQAAGNPGLRSRDALDVVRALQSLSARAEEHAGSRPHHDRRPEPDARGA